MIRLALCFSLCLGSIAYASDDQRYRVPKPGHLRPELPHPAFPNSSIPKLHRAPMNLLDPGISLPANPKVDPKITIKEPSPEIDPRIIIPYPPEPGQKHWKTPLNLSLPDSLMIPSPKPDMKN